MDVIYKLNGVDLRDYGVHVSGSDGLLSKPRPKRPMSVEWADYNGEVVDLAKRTYEPRAIQLDCFIKAASQWEFQDKCNTFMSVFDTANTKRLQVGVSGFEGGENLLAGSQSIYFAPNNTGTGASVLMTNESENYHRATPDLDKKTYLAGPQFDFDGSKNYIYSIDVRIEGAIGGIGLAGIRILNLPVVGITVKYNQWTRIYMSSEYASGARNIFIYNASTSGEGKYLDYKNAQIEIGLTASKWKPAISDIKPLVFEVYNSDSIEIKKEWSERNMAGTFSLKLIEPEPIKRVIKFTRTSDANKTVSITVTTAKMLNIYWGDGSHTYDVLGTSQYASHSYSSNGTYYIIVTGNIDEIISFTTTGEIVWNKL